MAETKNKIKSKLIEGQLSYELNGILFQAHNELGRFAKEIHYGDFIEAKLKENKISYIRELIVGNSGNTIDFNIDDKIILELKSKPYLTDTDYSQVKRYLHQTNLELGVIVNFREKILEPKRVLNINKDL